MHPHVVAADHPIVAGLPTKLPAVPGYDRVMTKPSADLIVAVGEEPLISAGTFGRGRSVAFTSDCGPRWWPRPFVSWEGYATMQDNLVRWAAGR